VQVSLALVLCSLSLCFFAIIGWWCCWKEDGSRKVRRSESSKRLLEPAKKEAKAAKNLPSESERKVKSDSISLILQKKHIVSPVFGRPLKDLVEDPDHSTYLPFILEKCFQELHKEGRNSQ
jgi:hypothetical protein